MTDRELLEAAAKALGVSGEYGELSGGDPVLCLPAPYGIWSPLTDDGDALRLAVKLGLIVDAGAHAASDGGHTKFGQVGERDPYAATRRAIVRAAASLAATPAPKE